MIHRKMRGSAMRATALLVLLWLSPLPAVLCFAPPVQGSAFAILAAAKTAQNGVRLRMALSPHWQAQREALRNAFLKKSALFNRDTPVMLKLFYDPLYEQERERVVDALSAETELPKDYVSTVFDKAKQIGAMDLCYQTADDALRTVLKMRDQSPPIMLTMKAVTPELVPEREPYPE